MALPEDTTSWTSGLKPTISAQNDLQNDEERFRALFENSIDAVLLINADGRIEAANPEACQLLDRTAEEICQLNWAELLDSTDGRLQSLLREREQTGRFRGELNCRRKDGSVFQGEVSSTSYRDKSGAFKASVFIRDITERTRVAETLRDIVEGTAGSTGDDFFCSLVKHLSHAERRSEYCSQSRSHSCKDQNASILVRQTHNIGEHRTYADADLRSGSLTSSGAA